MNNVTESNRAIALRFAMLRVAGFWWIAVSVIHGLVGIFGYFDQWEAIAQDGWFNAIAPHPLAPMFDREDALFFTVLTPFLFLIGKLCLWAYDRDLVLPTSVGVVLVITICSGIFLLPISGFWLALPPSLMLMWSSLQPQLSSNN
jgi:Family of unknown function (DUF6463)